VRPGQIAAVSLAAAVLGGALVLAIAAAAGWLHHGSTNTTTVIREQAPSGDAAPVVVAKPLAGNGFQPAQIYRARAAGVVTIFSLFGSGLSADTSAGQGSGFIVGRDGTILTSAHVITTAGSQGTGSPSPARSVYVEFSDGDRVPARIVGYDLFDDVGVLRVDPAQHAVKPVPLGDSDRVVVGEPVAAIGSPFGNESSLSVGVVSATERSIASLTSSYDLVDAIQTDAPINRGNSGGPMFDARGRVIGINAQINSNSGTAEGVGFAVPINSARRSMEQLIETGEVRYAWLGVSTQTLTPRLADHFDYSVDAGAAVQTVVDGSPADGAGIQAGGAEKDFTGIPFRPGGDLIVAIDGVPVETAEDVVRAIAEGLLPGQTTNLTVLRDGKRIEVTVKLGQRPESPPGSDR
jgi:2-alkenal reductase